MKHHLHILLTFVAILSLLLTGAASSVERPEPERPARVKAGDAPLPLAERDLFENPRPLPAGLPSAARHPAGPLSSTVTPGLSGTSFRSQGQIGVTEEPYVAFSAILNGPSGLFIDSANNVYVVEAEGQRILRFAPNGTGNLTIGVAGVARSGLEDYLAWPEDLVTDSSGDIWAVDQNRVVRFDSSSTWEMSFPAPDDDPDQCWDDVNHFCVPAGIAFSPDGRLFVSDNENHRIQIFTLDVNKNLTYSATIGTGVAGEGNNQFKYPAKIAIDSLSNLYVADSDNYRVQKCLTTAPYTCTTFHGLTGSAGWGNNELDYVPGVAVDAANNVYIADSGNWRVKKCTPTGVCSNLIPEITDPQDVAVDSAGNVYVAQVYNSHIVTKWNSAGVYVSTLSGMSGLAYAVDAFHIYGPAGIAADSQGNVYVSERSGNRWLKYDRNGNQVWALGQPGYRNNNPAYFGDQLLGNPAISGNRLYLPSGNQRCVRVYDLNGVYQGLDIGQCQGNMGDSGTLLGNIGGVAVSPVNGNIYVVDRGYHKVKIYNSSHAYLGLLGQNFSTGYGAGDYQFKQPIGIAIDSAGSIYVADRDNHRVQKYNTGGYYQYSIGETGVCEWDYDHLCAPAGVAVDKFNRVYIAENWQQRVVVFDASKNYLATIGGNWGGEQGQFRTPGGVAVGPDGTVYVTDRENHRVQTFAYGGTDFMQVNVNGFGDIYNGNVHALEGFGGFLFAGTYNDNSGGQVWKMAPDGVWTRAADPGFGNGTNRGMNDLVEYDGQLYVGVRNDTTFAAQIYRSPDGAAWENVVTGGLGDTNNIGVYRLEAFGGQLYAGTANFTNGLQIWRSTGGASGSWSPVVTGGYSASQNNIARSSAVHNGQVYFGSQNYDPMAFTTTGAIIITSDSGDEGDWTQVIDAGFGDSKNFAISSLAEYNGYLYAATYRWDWSGIEVWRCQTCDSQADWEQVVDNGFGNVNNWGYGVLQAYNDRLFLVVGNEIEGMEVWSSGSGNSGEWAQLSRGGFGDITNPSPYPSNLAVVNNKLYIGSGNGTKGSQVWTYLNEKIYLPLMVR